MELIILPDSYSDLRLQLQLFNIHVTHPQLALLYDTVNIFQFIRYGILLVDMPWSNISAVQGCVPRLYLRQ